MDTSPLQAFTSNWPGDNLPNSVTAGIEALSGNAAPGQSVYLKKLVLEPIGMQVLSQFAAKNSFVYAQYASYDASVTDAHPPAWYGPRTPFTTPMAVHQVAGQLFGFPVSFNLEYVPGAEQNRGSGYMNLDRRSIIRITLPKLFPQIVLESNRNYSGPIGSFPTAIEPDQRINLEGDFDTYFDVFLPIGSQDEVLNVLAPNFMQLLTECASKFDIEFFGNTLTFITPQPIYTVTVMNEVLSVLQMQLSYMDSLLQSWNYLPHSQPFDTLNYAYFNGGVVKIGSMRLSPKAMLLLTLGGLVLFGILIIFMNG